MPFAPQTDFARRVGEAYGKYLSTFRSETGQVEAQLFEVGRFLVAHVAFAPGIDGSTVTDPYLGELRRFAQNLGKELRLIIGE